eukprot:scaffold4715_cov115-Cylindrotheca_fusiformis.AAC.4
MKLVGEQTHVANCHKVSSDERGDSDENCERMQCFRETSLLTANSPKQQGDTSISVAPWPIRIIQESTVEEHSYCHAALRGCFPDS